MEKLPNDLISITILSRLPIKTLMICKCVSKQWFSLISSSHFAETQLQRSSHFSSNSILTLNYEGIFESINYEAFDKNLDYFSRKFEGNHENKINTRLIASCNGLVLLISSLVLVNDRHNNDFDYIVYNPCLGVGDNNFVSIQNDRIIVSNRGENQFSFGFGYVSSTKDYSIVAISLSISPRRPGIVVYVYSLRYRQWQTPRIFMRHLSSLSCQECWYNCIGVLVNETLHWVFTLGKLAKYIGAFNLANNTDDAFKLMDLAPKTELGDDRVIKLCNMDGCLCAWGEYDGHLIKMWVMKEYGVTKSWTCLLKLSLGGICHGIFQRTESGKVMIVVENDLVLVDTRSDPPNFVQFHRCERLSEVVNYVQSLIRPNIEPRQEV
ncbi:F-box protein CPR30-like [Chenopodium quinoa]|uniref:F-box protein CPR30-like n=1 Tax=Chenopodium quinoa TaxID=63459 RepID=UPI000B77202D|nr:F-box protein CPR30-like [Chenopodium quinoa]